MKLLVKRGAEDADRLVKVDWPKDDTECSWLSLWWEPTEEDWTYDSRGERKSYRGAETEFHQLVSYFVPEGSKVYAGLAPGWSEDDTAHMVRYLDEFGFRYEAIDRLRRNKWWKRALFPKSLGLYVEANRNFAIYAFKEYDSWM